MDPDENFTGSGVRHQLASITAMFVVHAYLSCTSYLLFAADLGEQHV